MSKSLNIPTVDLGDLSSSDPVLRRAACHGVLEGFGSYGLVYVRGHGVDPARLDAFYDNFAAFTARPDEAKRPLGRPDLWFQRGWTPPNTERAVASGGDADFKECYFAAPVETDPEAAVAYPEVFARNLWPEDLPAFHDDYLALGRSLHHAALRLLRGCAEALDLPAQTFTAAAEGGAHLTRALRYLPLTASQVDAGVLWGEEHTDFNLLTLLPGGRFRDPQGRRCPAPDTESGLYLRTRPTTDAPAGHRVRGSAPPGCLVAQVGQQLEILTGGTFLATPHVVTAPRTAGYERYSCAHFVHLHPHQVLSPIARFVTPEVLRAYSPPVLAGTYALKTLVDIRLAPPGALDLLGYRHYDRLSRQRAAD